MSLSDVFLARDPQPSDQKNIPSEDLSEFLWLREQTQTAMRTSNNRETVQKLSTTLQEIEVCIRNLERAERH